MKCVRDLCKDTEEEHFKKRKEQVYSPKALRSVIGDDIKDVYRDR